MIETTPFWPITAEGWTTLIANSIAIATFALGRRALLEWAISIRRALEAMRYAGSSGAAPPDVTLLHVHIQLERPTSDGRWHILWTLPDGNAPRAAIARVTSTRLRWHLHWHKKVRDLIVFGEVRFLETPNGPALVEVPTIDYLTRGGMWGWLARILFG